MDFTEHKDPFQYIYIYNYFFLILKKIPHGIEQVLTRTNKEKLAGHFRKMES